MGKLLLLTVVLSGYLLFSAEHMLCRSSLECEAFLIRFNFLMWRTLFAYHYFPSVYPLAFSLPFNTKLYSRKLNHLLFPLFCLTDSFRGSPLSQTLSIHLCVWPERKKKEALMMGIEFPGIKPVWCQSVFIFAGLCKTKGSSPHFKEPSQSLAATYE